jgi:hypothetical protein
MKVTKTELLQIIKEEVEAELNEFDGPYGDDTDSPSLETQMGDAILAAIQALESGDLAAARAAFPESLLKNLRPYDGPEGSGPSADMEDYESDYRDPASPKLKKSSAGGRPLSADELDKLARDI